MKNVRQRIVAFVAGIFLGPAIVFAGLESGTYISDLVATNPLGSDLASTLDDHIRLVKSTVKTTFPNINGAVSSTDEELSLLAGRTGTVWTSANDGAASTLDADLLDGVSSAGFCQTGGSGCPTIAAAANPTGTIGLSAVNGSAGTYLRSDGAPALSQAISPTWTGTHRFSGSPSGIDGPVAINSADPRLHIYETDATADNRFWRIYAASESLNFDVPNDAVSSANTWLTVDRTGTTVDKVSFPTDAAAGNFEVGPATVATVNNARMRVRTASSGVTAAQFTNAGGAGPVVAIHNQDTSVDAGFITFVTDASSVRGSITYDRGGGLVSYGTSSADNLKRNIRPAKSARGIIDCIPVVSHDWKNNGAHMDYWVTAGKLNKCAPFAVSYTKAPEVDGSVDVSKLVPAMIKYMQEQEARIGKLEAQLKRMN